MFSIHFIFFFLFFSTGVHQGCAPPVAQPDASEPTPDTSPKLRCFNRTPDTPTIKQFSYGGQLPGQPRMLRFGIKWADTSGSLLGGHYQFTLEGTPYPRFSLPESEALKTANQGTFQLLLELPKQTYTPKQQISIELKIWDIDGNASNQPLLVLEISR